MVGDVNAVVEHDAAPQRTDIRQHLHVAQSCPLPDQVVVLRSLCGMQVNYQILALGQLYRILERLGTPPPGNQRAYPHLGYAGFMLEELLRTLYDVVPALQEAR